MVHGSRISNCPKPKPCPQLRPSSSVFACAFLHLARMGLGLTLVLPLSFWFFTSCLFQFNHLGLDLKDMELKFLLHARISFWLLQFKFQTEELWLLSTWISGCMNESIDKQVSETLSLFKEGFLFNISKPLNLFAKKCLRWIWLRIRNQCHDVTVPVGFPWNFKFMCSAMILGNALCTFLWSRTFKPCLI